MRGRFVVALARVLIALPLAAAGCARQATVHPTPASGGTAEREILAARRAQNQAIAAYDADRVAAFWTDDVELRRGLGQLVVGRAAYRQLFLETGNRDSALVYQREPSHIESSPTWPLAFESGTWEAHVGRVDGPVVIRGQYGAQWVKRDGRWLIRGEVFVALTCEKIGCSYSAAP
jgi:ketosteroid isomerase-like protein